VAPLTVISGSGPFTVEHFRQWCSELVLDTGEKWVLEDFQAAFIADLFSGVKELWLVIPEGNGKTTLIAAVALYHCQFTVSANVPVSASSSEQAQIVYQQAEGFAFRTPGLGKLFRCLEGYKRINCESMNSRIQVKSADEKTGDGAIPTLAILDELHRHKDLRLYRTWRGKLAKRRGAQIIAISTAGEPGGEFEQTRENIRAQAEVTERKETFLRAQSEHLILHEYAVPEDGDVEDIPLVKRANPFSGITEEILTEKFGSPTLTLAHWRRFTCNLPSRSSLAAIQESEWADAKTDEQIPIGESVWIGLDVGWKLDTTAIVPLWWKSMKERILGPAAVLVPPRDGTSLKSGAIKDAFLTINKRNPIHTVVMDITRAEELSEWLTDSLGCRVVERGQTNQFAAMDYERFMEGLRLGWLKHSGDADMTKHALNAIARLLPLGGARFARVAESRSSNNAMQDQRVIDALIAAAMVHCVAVAEAATPEWAPMVAFI
jgi:phage terminase large subunit-like protein